MNLTQIITANEDSTTSIEFSQINKYKKSLYTYYKNLFCCEPILMVTNIFNAAQFCKIVPSNEFTESICQYLDVDYIDESNEEIFSQYENICFNSLLMSKTLN